MFADFFLEHYGPTLKAAERLSGAERQELRAELVSLAETANRATDGTLRSSWEYLTVVATRD